MNALSASTYAEKIMIMVRDHKNLSVNTKGLETVDLCKYNQRSMNGEQFGDQYQGKFINSPFQP